MPTFLINSNIPASAVPGNFMEEMTELVASLLGKPKKYVSIHVSAGQLMSFNGTSDPCLLSELSSIGGLGADETKKYTPILMEKLSSTFNIPMDRMYIRFTEMERYIVGWNGKTFAS